jgi:hypothetical protein
MCTDFTDLSKCCPKYDFPLARIDKIVVMVYCRVRNDGAARLFLRLPSNLALQRR